MTLHLFSKVPISASMPPPVACSIWSNSDWKVSSGLICGHSSLVTSCTCLRVPVFAKAMMTLESISAMLSTLRCVKTDFISALVKFLVPWIEILISSLLLSIAAFLLTAPGVW